jgi:hypothetical protein
MLAKLAHFRKVRSCLYSEKDAIAKEKPMGLKSTLLLNQAKIAH